MDIVLSVLYGILLVFCIILLISTVKAPSNTKWLTLFISEALFALASVGAALVFNSLEGEGFMPGLTYFPQVIVSIVAALVFTLAFAISAIVYIIWKIKSKHLLGGGQE